MDKVELLLAHLQDLVRVERIVRAVLGVFCRRFIQFHKIGPRHDFIVY